MSTNSSIIPPALEAALPLKADRDAFALLRQQIAKGGVVAFIGAGISVRAGFRDWTGLVTQLNDAVSAGNKRQKRQSTIAAGERVKVEDLTWRADEIRDAVPSYLQTLGTFFSQPGRQDAAIQALARLGFRHIFTTNYDRTLEQALEDAGQHVEAINWGQAGSSAAVLRSFDQSDDKCYLVYLHGRCDCPETIVLSERDYRLMYVRSDETMRRLFALFSFRRVAFFGASLTDIDVLSVFRQVFAARENSLHFAVMPMPKEEHPETVRGRLLGKFGISTIFYDPANEHANLVPVIGELHSGKRRKPRKQSWKFTRGIWSETAVFKGGGGKVDPEDVQKGRFGGMSRCNGRILEAEVTPTKSRGWYDVNLLISATNGRPLKGTAKFWLHQTFGKGPLTVRVHQGVANMTIGAYGAFTVGATVDGGRTPLELDLAELESAPEQFRLS